VLVSVMRYSGGFPYNCSVKLLSLGTCKEKPVEYKTFDTLATHKTKLDSSTYLRNDNNQLVISTSRDENLG